MFLHLKGREIISLPIIDKSVGREIGEVKSIVYDAKEKKLKALIIQDGGWLWGKNLIHLEDIDNIGRDAVIVSSLDVVVSTSDDNDADRLCHKGSSLIGNKVITNSGNDYGVIEDIVVESNSGSIVGLEISNGLLADLIEGRTTIKYPNDITYGEDALIVNEEIIIEKP